ncbi:protein DETOXIFICATION 14-like isoform X2 [Rhododendron vialii]|uniref:protein DETOXIFICATION 14-like isoform X2 n=1 Tax=Rhododendron vialii TaxID=182163 RepID=UPI00265F1120|nr:protein DETOXIFICATION 14-like isoform X2 [Rhododendron vialii]
MEEEALLVLPEENDRKVVGKWKEFVGEMKKVGSIATPMVVVTVSQYLLQVVSMSMAGHLGEISLSSAAIATSFTNVTGFSLLFGMAGALETLCGQAYGAEQYKKLGVYTYSAIVSLLLVCLPVSVLWIFLDKLLLVLGQDPLISQRAGKYAIWLIPALFPYAILQSLVRYLQTQSLILPMLLCSVATLFFHIPLCWVLVFKLKMGNSGAALTIGLSYWLNVILLGFYVKYSSSVERTRTSFSRDVFLSTEEFVRFAVPSAIMVWYGIFTSAKKYKSYLVFYFLFAVLLSVVPNLVIFIDNCSLEWWSFELFILLSGLSPNPELETSVLSIWLTTATLHFYIPYSFGVAASTRVSNELGAGNPDAARLAVWAVIALDAIEDTIASATLFCCRHILGRAFSNDKEVVDYVTDMAPLLCISIIMDSFQAVLSGVARGSGWQHIGAFVNLGAFYLVAIPVALLLGFVLHMGGRGFVIGLTTGPTIQFVLLSLVTSLTDWQKQATIARERAMK